MFRQLRDLGLDDRGSVMVGIVDADLTEAEPAAMRPGARHGEIAPVWEMVEAGIRGGGLYAPSFFVLLIIAGLIACVGILTNSQILVVGAMVVGPEYNAIISVALGIERGRPRMVRRGLVALLCGFLMAIAAAVVFGVAIRWSGRTPAAFQLGVRPVTTLIDSPNLFSVVVAVLAAIVGAAALRIQRLIWRPRGSA